ncbi:hypothetical protein PBV88_04325 [Streptomyces sp. T21Q-yed]|nr:hypothetical protein [Streptomyces sp. T12]MDF3140543.1 hypothetical protein [Streptomyces sp. T21Q-yed]WDF36046.1 hypothetical protein PBV52_04240 [Streptomyces sp. T12]
MAPSPGRRDRHVGPSPVLRHAQLVGVPAEAVLGGGAGPNSCS